MAKFTISQMTEVWFSTEIEADSFEDAIAAIQYPANPKWERDFEERVGIFMGFNQETEEQFYLNNR
jgi:hypothetical protein